MAAVAKIKDKWFTHGKEGWMGEDGKVVQIPAEVHVKFYKDEVEAAKHGYSVKVAVKK